LRLVAELMLKPSPSLVREFSVPPEVVEELSRNREYRALTMESLGKVRDLMDELGMVTPRTRRLWRALGAAA